MPGKIYREIFFDPATLTLVFICGIGMGLLLKIILDTFGSWEYMPVLFFGVIAVISLFEIWGINFCYFPKYV
jgi:hypothetical protein